MVIRGTISQKKFKKDIHQYSNKTENTFASTESTYLCFCFFHCHLWKYSIFFFSEMEENDCKNARYWRDLVLQQRLNARSNQHSCKFLTSHLNHLTSECLHQTFIYKFYFSMFICFWMLQISKKRMQEKKLNLPTILLKVFVFFL